MISHAPPGYECPFCALGRGSFGDWTTKEDVIFQTEHVTAFIASHWWPANPGAAIVIPNAHYENIYEIPSHVAEHVHEGARRISRAMKSSYGCDGISTRQHNEPSGNQEVWHYHLHVFPRWTNDRLYERHRERAGASEAERAKYAAILRGALGPLPLGPWPRRIPVCVGAVVVRNQSVLFVRQATEQSQGGRWTIPWGLIEPGQTPDVACLAEVSEEAGLRVEIEGLMGIHNIVFPKFRPSASFAVIFRCRPLGESEPIPDGIETDAAQFLDVQQWRKLGDSAHPMTVWLAERAISGRGILIRKSMDSSDGLDAFI